LRVRLLQLSNDAGSSEKISEEGEDAQIINIIKRGNKSICNNYR
jgi:hypothetical protein